MNRTGSIASRVPPAVTTTWRPARSASWAGPVSGGRAAGSGGTDRAIADGRDDRVDDGVELGQPPDAGLAGGERPGPGLDDQVAERAQPRRRWRPSRDGSTCRRPSPARRRPGPTSRGRSRSRRHPTVPRPCSPASARSPAPRRRRRPCRRGRCGRSVRRAAGRGRRSRPGGATAPRTTGVRRSARRTRVSITDTSAPSARRSRSSSTAL